MVAQVALPIATAAALVAALSAINMLATDQHLPGPHYLQKPKTLSSVATGLPASVHLVLKG